VNLHAIASGAVGVINPNLKVTLRLSTGYTVAADGTQVPNYAAPVTGVTAQIQAVSTADLQKAEGMNLGDITTAIYLFGRVNGVNRDELRGGDLIVYPAGTKFPFGTVWLVTAVLEQWPDWCKVAVTRQLDYTVPA